MKADLDELINDCQAALAEARPQAAMREVLQRLISRPGDLLDALPASTQSSTAVHLSPELSILEVVNAPGFRFHPHDHGSWSACAYYAGREYNTFYRRTTQGLEVASTKEYDEGDVSLMGADAIHAIENPLQSNNAALHVFAGNPFTAANSQWDPQTLVEAPFDAEYAMAVYPSPEL